MKSMKPCQFKYIYLVVICILLISSFGMAGCKNTEGRLVFSSYSKVPENPPKELSISQLYEDYITDPIAADDQYKWKRLCFYEVEVEEIIYRNTSTEVIKEYFIANNIKFILRSASKMQNVEPGCVLNLVGECRGIENVPREVIVIKNCWAEGVNCDLGEAELFYPGY